MTKPQQHYRSVSASEVTDAMRHEYSAPQMAIAIGEADMSGRMEIRRFTLVSNGDGTYDLRIWASA